MKIIDAEQRSEAWFAARAGRITGSRAADILAKIKTGEAAARRDYRLQLAVERLTGKPQESGFCNAEMQRGIDLEPMARAQYEGRSGNFVRQTGFCQHDDLLAGCSLDGDIDEFEGILELKVPKSSTHIEYLKGARLPPAYIPQITHNLWISGAAYCDFVSFDDRMPPGLEYFCVRVHINELSIPDYQKAALAFLDEVEAEHQALLALRGAA